MECNRILRDAIQGITFKYKLDDVLMDLGSQKLGPNQIVGYLSKRGVSPYEIKQSGILEYSGPPITGEEWLKKSGKQRITEQEGRGLYRGISLGENENQYKESLALVDKPDKYQAEHFKEELPKDKALLGWRRTHVDNINGEDTLVLDEFQSDWAQAERKGEGIFESTDKTTLLDKRDIIEDKLTKKYGMSLAEIFQSWKANKLANDPDITKFNKLNNIIEDNEIIADFPMSEVKHHQYQIVKSIDEAMSKGIKRIAIPIERENELQGTKAVTEFYKSLNQKVLPDIRKKLEKQGLRLKLSSEDYTGKPKAFYDDVHDLASEYLDDNDVSSMMDWLMSETKDNDMIPADTIEEAFDYYEIPTDGISEIAFGASNKLHILTIDGIPNKPIKWDVYGLASTLGFGEVFNREEPTK